MSTNYPGALDSFAAVTAGQPRSGSGSSPQESVLFTNIGDAVEAIEAELGINPSGSSDTVAERLAALTTAAGIIMVGGLGANGTTNASAINAAITAGNAATSGQAIVILPAGDIPITGSIAMKSGVTLVGQGRATKIRTTANNQSLITVTGTSSVPILNWGLRDLQLLGNNGPTHTGTRLLSIFYGAVGTIADVLFNGSNGAGIYGVAFWDSEIARCRFDGVGTKRATGTSIRGAVHLAAPTSTDDNCNNLRFRTCTWETTSSAACDRMVHIDSAGGTAANIHHRIFFDTCKMENHYMSAVNPMVYIEDTNGLFINGLLFVADAWDTASPVNGTALDLMTLNNVIASSIANMTVESQNSGASRTIRTFLQLIACANISIDPFIASAPTTNYPTVSIIEYSAFGNSAIRLGSTLWFFDGSGGLANYVSGHPGNNNQRPHPNLASVRYAGQTTARTATATMANDDVIAGVPVQAGMRYEFRAVLNVTAAATPDMKFQFTVPSGATLTFTVVNHGATTLTAGQSVGASSPVVVNGTGAATVIVCEGTLLTGTTPGNVALQWAQNTSDAGATTVSAGSYMSLRAI